MSEPRLISPLLDGHIMGDPISDHHGVRSCPALREETEERAIVKIISVPASQDQLDALLLTGALPDAERAKTYFKERAEEIAKEAGILSKLSKAGGFLPYRSSQIVPMEDGVGFDVYLLAPYHRTLHQQILDGKMTHLAAVNLGLDMCAALTVCRRAGYLYVDLKPENIFLTDTRGYCIGDLGLMSLSSLKFASLPEKYRSVYTAPEITDAYSSLNDTIDVYALGMVLYQVYNNGELPPEGEPPMPPLYADYELAEVILKAIAPDPAHRWSDPAKMGQALVDHMQRNVVNDDPIIPPPPPAPEEPDEEVPEPFLTEDENALELAELLASIPDEEPPVDDPSRSPGEDVSCEADEITVASGDGEPVGPAEEGAPSPEAPTGATEDAVPAEEPTDTTDADHPRTELTEDGVTVEVAQMLAQADELLLMELPEPVVAPAPIDVPIPPPIQPEPEPPEEALVEAPVTEPSVEAPEVPEAEDAPVTEQVADTPQDEPAISEDEDPDDDGADPAYDPELQLKKRRTGWWITVTAVIASMIAVFFIGKFLYQNYFLLTIDDLTVTGAADQIIVSVVTKADEEKLTIVCADTYGNTHRSPVTDGKATFSSLNANTQYKIQVQIEGKYKLMGHTTGAYTTAARTQILNLAAVNGPEDGSVILSFTVDGPDSERWKVEYYAPGIAIRTTSFVGKHITLSGLDTAVEYTFHILPEDDLYVTGNDTVSFRPQKAIYAQGLKVVSYEAGTMTVVWDAPSDVTALKWIVRCYDGDGIDMSLTTTETSATFEGLDSSKGYTVSVMAENMTKDQTLTVSPDPVHITGFHPERTAPWSMSLRWDYTGTLPEGGWQLTYTVDDGEPITVLCDTNETTLPLAPGASYSVAVSPAGSVTYFPMDFSFGPVENEPFSSHTVTAEHMSLSLHRCPTEGNWTAGDIASTETVTDFATTDNICLLIELSKSYDVSDQQIVTTFVIRDDQDRFVSTQESTQTWDQMWHARKCALSIPQLPEAPGTYTLDIYMQDQFVSSLSFSIT